MHLLLCLVQFLVMVQQPIPAGLTNNLTVLLGKEGGWISSFIPGNTFLVVMQRSHSLLLKSLPGDFHLMGQKEESSIQSIADSPDACIPIFIWTISLLLFLYNSSD